MALPLWEGESVHSACASQVGLPRGSEARAISQAHGWEGASQNSRCKGLGWERTFYLVSCE